MPIQPSDIKGDVALELDAELVGAEDFLSCAEAFLSLLKEITAKIHKAVPQDGWYITVQEGSQVINAAPNQSRISQGVAGEIIGVMVHGFLALHENAEFPNEFTEKAVEYARRLSRITMRTGEKRFPVRIIDKQRAFAVSRRVFTNASALLDWKYEDLGTVEGALEAVSVHGHYEFRIYEPVWSRSVKCLISEEMLEEALSLFRHRVEVRGLIRYTNSGLPISIKVEDITELPSPTDLPSYKEMRGILGDQSDARE